MNNPYRGKPDQAFWKPAIADRHFLKIESLWRPLDLTREDRIATAGSCFAQHIGRHLISRGANFINQEVPPPIFSSLEEERRWGFSVYSCRYGNIYTSRQLVQLTDEAFGERCPSEVVWSRGGRFFDALRPSVDPVGQDSSDIVLALRARHLANVRKMFETLDVFVFTLGLTEGWELRSDGTMFPMAPGVAAGEYDPQKYCFRNLSYRDVYADMKDFWRRLKGVNKNARLLLTVSPVPLTATASDDHILVATSYSKAVLRAVAGDLSRGCEDIYYFPSYEIISSHPARAMFYNPDLRTVNDAGVEYVMNHFFSGSLTAEFAERQLNAENNLDLDIVCDEETIERVK